MDFSKLDLYMEQMVQRGVPACELSVTKDGECVYRKCVGFSDEAATKPTCNKDIYYIYSATKVLTCISALRLIEEGKLSLDDPVSKYIPEFASAMVKRADGSITPAEKTMTVEHLFLMTGGMTYERDDEALKASPDQSTVGLVRVMAKSPLVFEPGTHYKYSLCHDVLGAVVEVASGMKLSAYMNEIMFKPLGITDIGFFPNEDQKSRISALYRYRNGIGKSVACEEYIRANISNEYESGGGGLFATVDEYMKIITVIACGGTTKDGYRLLKSETIEMMKQNRLCPAAHDDYVVHRLFGYGWGLCGRVHMDPVRSGLKTPVGEFGWDGAAGALVLMDTENKIAIYYGQHVMKCYQVIYSSHNAIKNLVYEGLGL